MSLRFKILSGFLILAVMLFAAGALSIYELTNIGHSVQSLLDENYKSINAAKNMIESLEREDSGVLLLLSGEWKTGRSTIEDADEDFQKAFLVAKNNVTIPGEASYVEAIMESYEVYRSNWNQSIAGTAKQGDLSWYFNQVHPAFLEAKTQVNRLMTLNDQTLYQTASALKNRAGRAIMPGVVAIIAALIFTAAFNFFINLYFIAPIKELALGIRNYIRKGERSGLRVTSSRDEIADLAAAIEELTVYQQEAGQD
jgi:HAMP domain-containing protein